MEGRTTNVPYQRGEGVPCAADVSHVCAMLRGMRRSVRLLAGAIIAAPLSALAAEARAEMPVANRLVRDTLTVAGKQVPLPHGAWLVAASAYQALPAEAP